MKIDVNSISLDEINRHYGGDFRGWAIDNIDDYASPSDYNIENFECFYDKKEAKKLLKNTKECIGISSEHEWHRDKIDDEKLSASLIQKPEIELKKVKVDIELMAKSRLFADTYNPKVELNYILLREKKAIATDTRVLIQSEHSYSFNDVLMPTYFIKPLQDGALLYMSDDNRLYIRHNKEWYEGITKENKEKMKYPDISNINPDSDYDSVDYKTIKRQNVFINGMDREDVSHIFQDGERVFLQKKYDELLNLLDVVSVQKHGDHKIPKPYFIHAKNGIEVTMMPLAAENYIEATGEQ